jgi:undecaprenyl-diphosphatase
LGERHPISPIQAFLLALLQGVSELFPVSSLGHTVVLPPLLGWPIDQQAPSFLAFVVVLHLGTALALLLYFRRDWPGLASALARSALRGRLSGAPAEREAWRVVVATVPAGLLGLLLEHPIRALFATPAVAAAALLVNGGILFAGEHLRRRARTPEMVAGVPMGKRLISSRKAKPALPDGAAQTIGGLSWGRVLTIGSAQALALVPGISRSGVTMVAGLVSGLDHEESARFAFLLSTPIILAAGLLEIPELFTAGGRNLLALALMGSVVAAVAAYASVRWLMRYFRSGRLDPFAYYCWAFGALALILLVVRG